MSNPTSIRADRCELWILKDPDDPYGPGRTCRNNYNDEYFMCEPCFKRQALKWVEHPETQRLIRYVRYLADRGLLP